MISSKGSTHVKGSSTTTVDFQTKTKLERIMVGKPICRAIDMNHQMDHTLENNTVDGRSPATVDTYYSQGFTHPRWLFGISSINSSSHKLLHIWMANIGNVPHYFQHDNFNLTNQWQMDISSWTTQHFTNQKCFLVMKLNSSVSHTS